MVRLPTGKRLLYLLAVIVLVPLTFALEYVFSKQEIGDRDLRPPIVAHGDTPVEFAGSRWRLASIRPGPAKEGARLPAGTTLVFVTVEVRPTNAAAGKKIEYCTFQVTNDEGDVWTSSFGLAATGGAARACTVEVNDERTPIPAGKTVSVVTTYLVPTEEAAKLRAVLSVVGARQQVEFHR